PALRHLAGRGRRRPAGAARRDPRHLPEVPDDPRAEGGDRSPRQGPGVGHRAAAAGPAQRRAVRGARQGAGRPQVLDARPRRIARGPPVARFGITLLPESLHDFGELCRHAEDSGFDWVGVADSQSVFRELYVALTLAALSTTS